MTKFEERIEKLKALGAPQAILDATYRRRAMFSRLDHPYRVVVRYKNEVKGKVFFRVDSMKKARQCAEGTIFASPNGTVVVIYVQCSGGMILDARYYVKHRGKVYESRARTYNKEGKDWLKAHPWNVRFGPKGDFIKHVPPYSDKWNQVKKYVEMYRPKDLKPTKYTHRTKTH